MNIKPPAERKCDQCLNSMNLNLFRLNSPICRYCQDGIMIPQRLLSDKQDNEAFISNEVIKTSEYKDDSKMLEDSFESQLNDNTQHKIGQINSGLSIKAYSMEETLIDTQELPDLDDQPNASELPDLDDQPYLEKFFK